jgi:hypothetical protein
MEFKEVMDRMMAKLRPVTGLLAAALLMTAGRAPAGEVDKYLPNETDLVCTINVRQILHSPVAKRFALNQQLAGLLHFWQAPELVTSLSHDLLKDVHKIVLANWGEGENWGYLVIAHGQFDTAKLPATFKELAKTWPKNLKEHKEDGHRFWEMIVAADDSKEKPAAKSHGSFILGLGLNSDGVPSGLSQLELSQPVYIALVDKSTIIFSPQKGQVLAAFQRAADGKRTKLARDLRDSILDQDPRQSLWFSVGLPRPTKKDPAKDTRPPSVPDEVVFSEGGFTINDGVKFHATITARNAEAAREVTRDLDDLRTRLQGLVALLAGNRKDTCSLTGIVRSFKDTRKGRIVTLEAQIPAAVFDDLEDLLKPSSEAAPQTPPPAAPAPMPQAAPPDGPPPVAPRLPGTDKIGSR